MRPSSGGSPLAPTAANPAWRLAETWNPMRISVAVTPRPIGTVGLAPGAAGAVVVAASCPPPPPAAGAPPGCGGAVVAGPPPSGDGPGWPATVVAGWPAIAVGASPPPVSTSAAG